MFLCLITKSISVNIKKMKNKSLFLISGIIFISAIFLLNPPIISAQWPEARMWINIDKESFLDPDYLNIEIIMESEERSYNAVMGLLNYDPAFFNIEEVAINQAFCALIVGDLPSQEEGTKPVICGNPEANETATTTLATFKLRKLDAGWTKISLDGSRMLSSDGLARDLLHYNETNYLLIE
jgi:hypothetical protein